MNCFTTNAIIQANVILWDIKFGWKDVKAKFIPFKTRQTNFSNAISETLTLEEPDANLKQSKLSMKISEKKSIEYIFQKVSYVQSPQTLNHLSPQQLQRMKWLSLQDKFKRNWSKAIPT